MKAKAAAKHAATATGPADDTNALELRDVRVLLHGGTPLIDGVDLTIRRGEILALVGESGSGKTTVALSVLGHTAEGLSLGSGEVVLAGRALKGEQAFRGARGRVASYVPQNPGTALNPSLRITGALRDAGRTGDHSVAPADLLDRVGLPNDAGFARRFPHQLSGGQQQRVCIAGSIAAQPSLVILDEPTTGLDVVSQDRILTELLRLRDEEQVAMLYITHDLAVAARIADTIAVMYAGQLVETGPTREVLRDPRHPYTRGLIASTPDHLLVRPLGVMPGIAMAAGDRGTGCTFAPRCPLAVDACATERPRLELAEPGHQVRCPEWRRTSDTTWANAGSALGLATVEKAPPVTDGPAVLTVEHLRADYRSRRGAVVAADDISFTVARAACTALVGESGSGKTTTARALAGLHPIAAGRVLLQGDELPHQAKKRTKDQRRRIQVVFQNPAEALNPHHTVEAAIARPARKLLGLDARAAEAEVERLLDAVRLPASIARRYPRELSGGERQRVAIARALAADPELLICDEVTSALDVSVQAVVLELLRDLRTRMGLAMIFITHDLGVVASAADEVLVLHKGLICERGATADVLEDPQHEYTRTLLSAAPSLSASRAGW